MSLQTISIRKWQNMTVCGQHVLSGMVTQPGMMGRADISIPNKVNRAKHESC